MQDILQALEWFPRQILNLIALLQPETFEQAISLITVLGTGIGAAFALVQYRDAGRWKVVEFIVPEMRAFFEKPQTKAVCKMMDWTNTSVSLGNKNERLEFNRAQVLSSLKVNPPLSFPPNQETIRDLFDDFFTYLENLQSYIGKSNGVFKAEVLRPYLRYYLEIINNDTGDDDDRVLGRALRKFVNRYEYYGVIQLTESVLGRPWAGPTPKAFSPKRKYLESFTAPSTHSPR